MELLQQLETWVADYEFVQLMTTDHYGITVPLQQHHDYYKLLWHYYNITAPLQQDYYRLLHSGSMLQRQQHATTAPFRRQHATTPAVS